MNGAKVCDAKEKGLPSLNFIVGKKKIEFRFTFIRSSINISLFSVFPQTNKYVQFLFHFP